jgi:hypothetical protein
MDSTKKLAGLEQFVECFEDQKTRTLHKFGEEYRTRKLKSLNDSFSQHQLRGNAMRAFSGITVASHNFLKSE